jgi:hypothetical protein
MNRLGAAILMYLVFLIGGCDSVTRRREEDLRVLTLKSKCREDGEKVRSEWKRTYYLDTFSDEPGYSYSEPLKTCLWIDEYTGPAIDFESVAGRSVPKLVSVRTHVKFILDVYTNKPLIEYTEHDGKQIGDVSEADFKRGCPHFS